MSQSASLSHAYCAVLPEGAGALRRAVAFIGGGHPSEPPLLRRAVGGGCCAALRRRWGVLRCAAPSAGAAAPCYVAALKGLAPQRATGCAAPSVRAAALRCVVPADSQQGGNPCPTPAQRLGASGGYTP